MFPMRIAIKLGNSSTFWDKPTSSFGHNLVQCFRWKQISTGEVTASTTLSLNLAPLLSAGDPEHTGDTTQNTHACCPSLTRKIDWKPWFLTERRHGSSRFYPKPIHWQCTKIALCLLESDLASSFMASCLVQKLPWRKIQHRMTGFTFSTHKPCSCRQP